MDRSDYNKALAELRMDLPMNLLRDGSFPFCFLPYFQGASHAKC